MAIIKSKPIQSAVIFGRLFIKWGHHRLRPTIHQQMTRGARRRRATLAVIESRREKRMFPPSTGRSILKVPSVFVRLIFPLSAAPFSTGLLLPIRQTRILSINATVGHYAAEERASPYRTGDRCGLPSRADWILPLLIRTVPTDKIEQEIQ